VGRERIAVVGIGAIGGAIAADLADLGRHEVSLCVRTPFDDLVVRHPGGISRADAVIWTRPSAATAFPWVLLATKAHQSEAARPWLDALCDANTTVAVLQNGVDHVERIAPLAPKARRVLPVVVQLPAERIASGRIEQSRNGALFVPDDAGGRAFAALFEGARTAVQPRADFVSQAWWKLLSNAALGGVCALAGRGNEAARDGELRQLVLALMQEVARVGRAEGAALPPDAPERVLDRMLAAAPGHWSSIAVDRREGRPMEWRARNDVVGRLGRRHGIATPQNDAVTLLLRAIDARATTGS